MKSRILVISPVPSHPQNAGNRARIFTLLSTLQKSGFEIHYLYYEIDDQCPNVFKKYNLTEMEKQWDRFFFLSSKDPDVIHMMSRIYMYRKSHSNKINFNSVNIAKNVINSKKIILSKALGSKYNEIMAKKNEKDDRANWFDNRKIDDWYNSGIDSFVNRARRHFNYRIVLAEYVFMSHALTIFDSSVLKIIDTHDVFSERHSKYEKAGISERFFSTTMKEEAKGLNRADVIIAIQENEAEEIRKMTSRPVVTIGHKVRLAKPQIRKKGRNNILYVGAGNLGNIDGVDHFIEEAMPMIMEAVPGASLLIAGGICKYIQERPNCRLLGEVDRIEDAYQEADVVINPGTVGTGLKIKSIEALGFGKPAVLTNNASEGIEEARDAYLIANDGREFAEQVVKLLINDKLNEYISNNAYKYAVKYNEKIDCNVKALTRGWLCGNL